MDRFNPTSGPARRDTSSPADTPYSYYCHNGDCNPGTPAPPDCRPGRGTGTDPRPCSCPPSWCGSPRTWGCRAGWRPCSGSCGEDFFVFSTICELNILYCTYVRKIYEIFRLVVSRIMLIYHIWALSKRFLRMLKRPPPQSWILPRQWICCDRSN